MHEKRFDREISRLREPDRLARLEVDRVAQLALGGVHRPGTMLDIGTGSGLFAEKFAALCIRVTGVDVNPKMLPAAREHVPTGEFREGVAEKLPFPDASFDLVFMGLLLHETDNPLSALREAHRVGTGRLAILEWPEETQDFGPPPEHRLAEKAIVSLAGQAGFKTVESERLQNLVLYLADR
jgi:ubiquinone/menaquinone biosynthesis C-methylase UbiE